MKSSHTLSLALAATVLAAACQSTTEQRSIPRTESNWNSGSVSESASESFFGASSSTPHTIRQVNRDASVDVVTTTKRHMFNDNPDNPLQEHRYDPDDRYVPIWHMPVYAVGDGWDMLRAGGTNLWDGTVALVMMPVQLLVGADQNTGVATPPEPEDFRVKNP
jgi:hypothetical protein